MIKIIISETLKCKMDCWFVSQLNEIKEVKNKELNPERISEAEEKSKTFMEEWETRLGYRYLHWYCNFLRSKILGLLILLNLLLFVHLLLLKMSIKTTFSLVYFFIVKCILFLTKDGIFALIDICLKIT